MAGSRSYRNRFRNRHPASLLCAKGTKWGAELDKSLAKMFGPCPSDRRYLADSRKEASQGEDREFSVTPRVRVYVMLPLGVINMQCELVDPGDLLNQLRTLKSVHVDGVTINAWWGIVEANNPQQYNWKGYKQLFGIVRELGFNIQVVMSFHECGDDDVHITLPKWIKEIGQENPDIYFTDREGRRNPETLTWGIDEEPVLRGRTAVEVYSEYMRSFRLEFDEFFQDRTITEIEIGLGACGVLRYPSCPAKHGWEYPGIGEFQCYDKYLRKCLEEAAKARGVSTWNRPPDDAGSYNSQPEDTRFFCRGYRSPYGSFFLNWYSKYLIDHGDRVLGMANLAFEGTLISAKLSGMHWWHETACYAAELTAGICGGYDPIVQMLKKYRAGLNFTYVELSTLDPQAMVEPEGLVCQVLKAGCYAFIHVASENAFPCYDRQGYNNILELAKPRNEPYCRRISAFTYLRLNQALLEEHNLREFQLFVKRMHGRKAKDANVPIKIEDDNHMEEADKDDTVDLNALALV